MIDPRDEDEGPIDPVDADPRVVKLLERERQQLLAERDAEWPRFLSRVLQRIEAEAETPPLTADVRAALSAELEREVAARDAHWGTFTARVLERIEDEVAVELEGGDPSLGRMLRAESEAALAAQDFAGFEPARLPTESAEVQVFKREVATELRVMAPRFEGPFEAEVEQRLPRRSVRSRAPHRDRGLRRTLGAVIVSVAAMLLVLVMRPWPQEPSAPAVARGEIQIDALRFEGTVTVTRDQGIAVIWLAETPS
ncbi:MAG: hypothetical protein IT384_22870 [Deltaproteobacteria bacterium]|nr:hypothetical protein [Deltaproteobacteria bacterium]